MTNLKDLFEKRRKADEQARSLMQKENRTAEDVKQADKWLDEALEAEKEFNAQRKMDEIDAQNATRMAAGHKDSDKAETGKSAEEIKIKKLENFRHFLITGQRLPGDDAYRSNVFADDQRAAVTAQTTTTSGGGYAVPVETKARITEAMLAMGGMYANSTIIRTPGGGQINWPTNNDTANVAQQLAESTSIDSLTQNALVFGQFVLDAYKFTSGAIKVPVELLQDSVIDMEAFIIKQLTTRMWRGLNAQWTTGTGSGAINGVVTASYYAAIASTDNTGVTRDNIVDLMHSVNSIYRPGAKFMMNDATLLAIKKLAFGTSDDRPLWQSGMAFGAPDTLEGAQYIINPDMPTMAAGAKSILFGDFSNYYIREVAEWRIVRLGELYALLDQVAFVVFARYDGDLDDAGTHPVKHLLNATNT